MSRAVSAEASTTPPPLLLRTASRRRSAISTSASERSSTGMKTVHCALHTRSPEVNYGGAMLCLGNHLVEPIVAANGDDLLVALTREPAVKLFFMLAPPRVSDGVAILTEILQQTAKGRMQGLSGSAL